MKTSWPVWVVVVLSAVLLSLGTASAGPMQEVTSCVDCHGSDPQLNEAPIEGAQRNVPMRAIVGSHTRHMEGIYAGTLACADCHVLPSGADDHEKFRHRNGIIDFIDPIKGGSYSLGTAVPQTNKIDGAGTGNCVNTSCHGPASPVWGTQGGQPTCFVCHGNPANLAPNYAPETAAHQAHMKSLLNYSNDVPCSSCHVVPAAVDMLGTDGHLDFSASGTADVLAGLSFNAGTHTCNNAMCHGMNLAAAVRGSNPTPVWTNASYLNGTNADCGVCHANPPTASVRFSHTGISAGADCSQSNCHPHNGSTGDVSKHMDGVVTGTASCTGCHTASDQTNAGHLVHLNNATYINQNCDLCHGTNAVNGQHTGHNQGSLTLANRMTSYTSPNCVNTCHDGGTWASGKPGSVGTLACADCHKSTGKLLTYNPTSGLHANVTATVRDHDETLTGVVGSNCQGCHTTSPSTGHLNGTQETSSPAIAIAAAVGFVDGAIPTCANACHSDGGAWQRQWSRAADSSATDVGSAKCDVCHGQFGNWRPGTTHYLSATTLAGRDKGGDHNSLTGALNVCEDCHAYPSLSANHENGAITMNDPGTGITVSGTRAGGGRAWCSNCHVDDGAPSDNTHTFVPSVFPLQTVDGDADPIASVSNGGTPCYNCHNAFSTMANDANTYHHVLGGALDANGDLAPNAGTYPNSQTDVYCTSCHTDHNYFNTAKASNLRTTATTTSGSTTTNSDFTAGGSPTYGVCLSCHSTSITKDMTNQKNEGMAVTPAITGVAFDQSAHDYAVTSEFGSGNTFNANCSKCHNDDQAKTKQTSANKFGTHISAQRSILSAMGSSTTNAMGGDFCFRCHSKTTDVNPGNGPAKTVANRDYFGNSGAVMSAASEDIFATMQLGSSPDPGGSPTTTTNELFFRPASEYTPPGTLPTAHLATSDTFSGGTYVARGMAPYSSTVAYETRETTTQTVGTGTLYWRRAAFISPTVATGFTTTAGTWTITIYDRESATGVNAFIRYAIYTIGSNGALKNTITPRTDFNTEMGTTAAPGAAQTIPASGAAVAVAAGDRIVVDLEIRTAATASQSNASMALYFGSGAPSGVVMPNNVTFNYTSQPTASIGRHEVALFKGLHTYDETREEIAAVKHVECNDCHTTHEAKPGSNHSGGTATGATANTLTDSSKSTSWTTNQWAGYRVRIVSGTGAGQTREIVSNTTTALTVASNWTTNPAAGSGYMISSNTLRGANGVGVTTWSSTNWGGVTTFNPSSTTAPLIVAELEWEICFKCHSSANASYSSWALPGPTAWTDLALEFNPANQSYHPVVAPLPATDPGANGSNRIGAAGLSTPWAPGNMMTCSDCHATSSTASKGPHGSSVKWQLAGLRKAWPFTLASQNGKATGTTWKLGNYNTGAGDDRLFCLNCHPVNATNYFHQQTSGSGQHSSFSTGVRGACVSCHIRVPHGGKVSRLIRSGTVAANLPSRYWPNGNGGEVDSERIFDAWTKPATWGSSSSFTDNASCTRHSGGGEAW